MKATVIHGHIKVFSFHKFIGRFENPGIEVLEEGAVRACVRVRLTHGNSSLTKTYIMYRETPGVFVEYKVFWEEEEHKLLKLCYHHHDIAGTTTGINPLRTYGKVGGWKRISHAEMGGVVKSGKRPWNCHGQQNSL